MPGIKTRKKNTNANFFNKIIRFFTFLLAFIIAAVVLVFCSFFYFNSAPVAKQITVSEQDGVRKSNDGGFYFEVRNGETAMSVGRRLELYGFIKNRYFWNLLFKLEKEHIKSGTYKLEPPVSQLAIQKHLVSGKQLIHRVTITEGLTINKISKILEDSGVCLAADFQAAARNSETTAFYKIPAGSMEGYLFPDTYFLPIGYPAEQIVKMMADNFFKVLETQFPEIAALSETELHQKVILASIVEREYRVNEEAGIIAGVFTNRLKINMGLQSCATVEYVITEIQGKPHPRIIKKEDLEINNRYNTYKWAGLPPGPISSPGTRALGAAFYPAVTEFLYFRLEDESTGRHYFSKTNDEHIRAGLLYTRP